MTVDNLRLLAQRCKLILGSGSPRRLHLLREAGVAFEQVVPEIEEHSSSNEHPYEFAERLACEKALWVAEQVDPEAVVIGCDTVVVLDNRPLGKPVDESDALAILKSLSGRQHVVCTAVALAGAGKAVISGYELTKVYFNEVSESQITEYIRTGEPMDKAGAYGIQGMGAFLVDRIEGQLDNVIGLPRLLLDNLAGVFLNQDK